MHEIILTDTEDMRQQFKPNPIKVLFVGESAPVNETFFYRANSQAYRYMKQAFGDPDDFLKHFKGRGFFLDDLVLSPVNHLTPAQRRQQCEDAIPSLAERLSIYRPLVVVSLMLAIEDMVEAAINQAGLYSAAHCSVPFPGTGQQNRFLEKMAAIIPQLP